MILAAALLMSFATEPDFAKIGRESLESLKAHYHLPGGLFSELPGKKQPAFNWGVGVVLSALNAAAQFDPAYKPELRRYADAIQVYWNDGGYDVLPVPKDKDRYYDDNAWMVLALVETHAILGDQKYLDRAEAAMKFVLSGEHPEGGIYWRESDRASRNTCSNAPAAAALMALYKVTKKPEYRAKASELYDWTEKTLSDPADNLLWDNISIGGKVERTKWSYNTALMIRAGHDLGISQKDRLASARTRWFKNGSVNDPGRFAHLLMEAVLQLDPQDKTVRDALRTVWAARRDGLTPSHWGELNVGKNPEILDQASVTRVAFLLASLEKS